MTAGQRSTTWNSPPVAPGLFGLRWLRRESIRALSVQRVLANPSCLFAIAMPKRERPIAEWRSELSPRPKYPSSRRPRKWRQNDDYAFTSRFGIWSFLNWGEHKRATAHSLHEHRRATSRLKWFYLWDKPSAIPETALWKNEKATFLTYRRHAVTGEVKCSKVCRRPGIGSYPRQVVTRPLNRNLEEFSGT